MNLEADGPIPIPVKESEHLLNEDLGVPPRHGVHVHDGLSVQVTTGADIHESTEHNEII